MNKESANAIGRPGKKRARRTPNTILVPNDDGKLIKVTLIPPRGKGKIDPKLIRAAVRKVRDERLKAERQVQGMR